MASSAAHSRRCEAWFKAWVDTDDVPDEADSATCVSGTWPPAGADGRRHLFACILYLADKHFDKAAQSFITSAAAAAAAGDTRFDDIPEVEIIDQTCRSYLDEEGLKSVLSKTDAAARLAQALRKGRERYEEFSASTGASAGASTTASAAVSAAAASTDRDGKSARKRARNEADTGIASGAAGAVSAGIQANHLEEDAAAYLRCKVLTNMTITRKPWKGSSPLVCVQKLLFYADAVVIAERGERFLRNVPEALGDGPVYQVARNYLNSMSNNDAKADTLPPHGVLTSAAKELLDDIFADLGKYGSQDLISMTHKEAPWTMAQQNTLMSERLMVEWFKHEAGRSMIDKIVRLRAARGSAASPAAPAATSSTSHTTVPSLH